MLLIFMVQVEVPEQAQAVLVELETFLTQIVGTEEGKNKNLDDTEEAYLLNYTDSITLSDMPVMDMLLPLWRCFSCMHCLVLTYCYCAGQAR